MTKFFDTIVIGKGLMGSAAARHLSVSGSKIALIGPDEPIDKSTHTGVFASHYDEGRITRGLDTDRDWSRLAVRSMARYPEIARQGELEFFVKCGALLAGNADYSEKIVNASTPNNVEYKQFQEEQLASSFSYFKFPNRTRAVFEMGAGYINPRKLVQAQITAACKSGATIISRQVAELKEEANSISLTTDNGESYTASNLIVAAGAFTNQLLAEPIPFKIAARTVVLFELGPDEIKRLTNMPSLIHTPDGQDGPYILPPIIYPDGKTYLKIGGDPIVRYLSTKSELTTWFQSDGDPSRIEILVDMAKTLLPQLRYGSIKTTPCVTTLTQSQKPVIQYRSNRIIALTGGNGASAKSSDEIGRLACLLAQGKSLDTEGYTVGFST